MGDLAIRASRVSKRYRLGQREHYRALRDVISQGVSRAFRAKGDAGRSGVAHLWALKDVSFEVHQGDVVGVIGRNGAGKSTLLKVLSRITEPTSGYVLSDPLFAYLGSDSKFMSVRGTIAAQQDAVRAALAQIAM